MDADFWETAEHRAFVEATDEDRAEALRDLLLLASLADDMLTNDERVDIAISLAKIPGLVMDFDSAELIDHIDDLYAKHEEEGGLLVADLVERLGEDEDYLVHALRIVTAVVESNNVVPDEERFVRLFGALGGIDDDVVDRVLGQAGEV